ncbi:MAG: lysoplasmalogenase [Acidimicrobiia bacterium]|nr:lysoplasmalogenase [Acidimicrobiia bacterium]
MTPAYVFAALTIPLVGLLLLAERRDAPWRVWAKAAASSSFIATAVAAGAAGTAYGGWVLAALCLGWAGDIALVSAQRRWFLLGLAAFLFSHLAYIGAFATVQPDAVVAVLVAAGLLVPAGLVARWLWPHLGGDMRVPVAAYIAVITAMVAAASGAAGGPGPSLPPALSLAGWKATVVVAAVAFYLSDVSVARDRFVAPGFGNRIWGLPLYYAAQLLFALSVGMR